MCVFGLFLCLTEPTFSHIIWIFLYPKGAYMASISKKTQGILYILTAAFGFSVMTLFVKLAGDLPAFQKSFFRNFVALLFIAAMMARDRISPIPVKKNIPDLLGRSFFGSVGLLCNFYAIGKLNLSDANMLNKLSPFFAIVKSALLSPSLSRISLPEKVLLPACTSAT